jgi:hypothetical protein
VINIPIAILIALKDATARLDTVLEADKEQAYN